MSRRKSTHEKFITGTARPDRARMETEHEPTVPTPPDWLPRYAKTVFRRTARLLSDAGALTQLDRDALSAYSVAVARWRDAERALDEAEVYQRTQSGYSQVTAQYTVASRARGEVLTAAEKLGLTPTSRGKLERVPPRVADADFLFGDWANRNPFRINSYTEPVS